MGAAKRRHVVLLIGLSLTATAAIVTIAVVGQYRVNMTPSEPLGLWRIEPLRRPIGLGDVVFVCLELTDDVERSWDRGYLRRGLCPGGFAPLIKTVAALPGQRVDVADHVVIDGHSIAGSSVRTRDGEGRPLASYAGGIVPAYHLYLHSPFASSYDSRYFGPVPMAGLLGLARPVLTVDP